MPIGCSLEINLPHKRGPIGIETRVLGSKPYVVGGGTVIGSRFVVSPASVVCRNQALLEEFGRLEATYVGCETRGVHNAWIERTTHGIEYHEQVTGLRRHQSTKGGCPITSEGEGAIQGNRCARNFPTTYGRLDLPPEDTRNVPGAVVNRRFERKRDQTGLVDRRTADTGIKRLNAPGASRVVSVRRS